MNQAAVESLVACLLEMAEAETNPVLQVIPEDLILDENKKYPTNLLQFNGLGWRAYYHCHPASRAGHHCFQSEHGHFHVFVRTRKTPEEWSHLVALAMDNMGQPLGWFTVNHWVTGEAWKKAAGLMHYLDNIPFEQQDGQVECWLLSLLALSHDTVRDVLLERDSVLAQLAAKTNHDIKQDKHLYLLSDYAIDLEKILNMKLN